MPLPAAALVCDPWLWFRYYKRSVVVGVLETFSPHAHVFTDGDVKTLITLSRRIMDTMIPPAEKKKEKKTVCSPAESFDSE